MTSFETQCVIEDLQYEIHKLAREKGFWDTERNVGEMIALVHSELSEGLEGHRKGLMDDHLPEYDSLTVELADAVIRILDMAEGLNLPLSKAIMDKVEYNRSRPRLHGKAY